MGARADSEGVQTKLAIVVSQTLAYGLARMYQAYRSFIPGATKDVHVFRDGAAALAWILRPDQGRNGDG